MVKYLRIQKIMLASTVLHMMYLIKIKIWRVKEFLMSLLRIHTLANILLDLREYFLQRKIKLNENMTVYSED